jgi:hypothetical protein
MKRILIAAIAVLAIAGTSFAFNNNDGPRWFLEFLNGLKEAPAIVSTTGHGTFRAVVSHDETEIHYWLTFKELEGEVRQAHIHIGHPQNSGGIVLWLCDSATNNSPVGTTPECVENDPSDLHNGWVKGTLTAADVQAQGNNGIAAGEWAEVLALIRAGKTYVNVHSGTFPSGEIRSQIDNNGPNFHGAHSGH